MTDREKVIKGLETCYCPPAKCEDCPYHDLPDEQSCNDALCLDAIALLKEQEEDIQDLRRANHNILTQFHEWAKEQEAKPPVHIYEEYPEHDWKRKENGDIDDFAWDGDYHNGPMCKRCYYSFCVLCDPNGWNKKPCIIDEYNCPKCGRYISKGTKYCSDCGQAVKWE